MDIILEFITTNYVWILSSLIVVLLIIIGYYADKTNFGQGTNKENDIEPIVKALEEAKEAPVLPNEVTEMLNKEIKPYDVSSIKETEAPSLSETTFEKYDKEIDELLPEKDVISGNANDLLSDINNLSLDKTQKINLSDIPDLDDVDLPRIKKLKKEDEDIWSL